MGDDQAIRELLATPPAEFVAARNAVVKERKAAGDREEAASIGRLRRLGLVDWALNVAAAEAPDAVAGFSAAAVAVIDAQEAAMAGRSGPNLREAIATLRRATPDVVAAARAAIERHGLTGAGSSEAEIASRLAEHGANRGAIGLLRRGLIGSAEPQHADPFAGEGPKDAPSRRRIRSDDAEAVPDRPPRRRRSRRSEAPAEPDTGDEASATETTATRRRRKEELTAAERAVARAETAATKAAARVADAESQLTVAQQALEVATGELEAARRRRDAAAGELAP